MSYPGYLLHINIGQEGGTEAALLRYIKDQEEYHTSTCRRNYLSLAQCLGNVTVLFLMYTVFDTGPF
ncbi:hypothetical protein FKM82_020281 [Ascaphus truei]